MFHVQTNVNQLLDSVFKIHNMAVSQSFVQTLQRKKHSYVVFCANTRRQTTLDQTDCQ